MNVLYLYIGDPSEKKGSFFSDYAKSEGIEVTAKAISGDKGKLGLIKGAFLTDLSDKAYDVVVTSEYFMAFGINLRLLLGKKIKHVVYGINQSAKLLCFRQSWLNAIINKIFNKASFFVTHSRAEMEIFHHIHAIPKEKFAFSHWGFDLPEVKEDVFANREKPYLSFVGRNNRDLKTFCQAIEGLDVDGVVITSKHNAPDFKLPDNLELHYDLSMDACISCLKHACMNVVLVKDDDRGAGHITIVASMLMAKPQIVSDVSVVRDYFVDQQHGISVAIGDAKQTREAILSLLDADTGETYGAKAYEYGKKYFINQASAKRLVDILTAINSNQLPEACNPQWLAEYNTLISK